MKKRIKIISLYIDETSRPPFVMNIKNEGKDIPVLHIVRRDGMIISYSVCFSRDRLEELRDEIDRILEGGRK